MIERGDDLYHSVVSRALSEVPVEFLSRFWVLVNDVHLKMRSTNLECDCSPVGPGILNRLNDTIGRC